MKRAILLLAAFLLFGSIGKAQCIPQFNFSTSESETASSDDAYVYANTQVFGSASMPFFCGQRAIHTPSLKAQLTDNVTGTTTGNFLQRGTSVCYNCYVSQSLTNSIILTVGDDYTAAFEQQVQCSLAGVFWSLQNQVQIHIEFAIVYVSLNDPFEMPTIDSKGDWTFAVNSLTDCTGSSQPPDWNPNTLTLPPDVVAAYQITVTSVPINWVGFTSCLLVNNVSVFCSADLLKGVSPSTTLGKIALALLGGAKPWTGTLPQPCTNHGKLNNDIGANIPPW
jgi:hypothetical protein